MNHMVKHIMIVGLSCGALAFSAPLDAHEDQPSYGAISHAPIGVMGDHRHHEGEVMLSYRVMQMSMSGMRTGTSDISASEVALMANPLAGETMRMGNNPNAMVPATYRISPIDMTMKMHMFGVMYGWSEDVTLMGMLNYQQNDMNLVTFSGMAGHTEKGRFKGSTSGLGDTKITAMVKLKDTPTSKLHYTVGLSLPTGSIKEKGSILAPNGMTASIDRLAYTMQLGSGSYDFLPSITYNGYSGDLGWGTQLSGVFRLNDNSEGYRLGNKVALTSWLAKQWKPALSTSIRLSAKTEGSIRGRDTVMTGAMPLFYAGNSGRDEVDLHIGINLLGRQGALKGHRLALEVGGPVYEKVNGLQMSNNWVATIGWQKAF